MADTGQLRAVVLPRMGAVTALRIAIIVTLLVAWELLAASGWLYRDVVPSLVAIARALVALLADPAYYWHLGVTAGEIGLALMIGGTSGLLVGLFLGASRLLGRA